MALAAPSTEPATVLAPGVTLDHSSRWVSIHFDEPRPVLSSAVLHGGLVRTRHWLNLKVIDNPEDGVDHPADTLAEIIQRQGWPGDTVAMMTAASMQSLRLRAAAIEQQSLLVAVTSGLANARRVGDRAEYRHLLDPVPSVGTINLAVISDLSLTPCVMVEALMVVTEAKAAVLEEQGTRSPVSGALATGTGTDALAIFGRDGGPTPRYAGKHTLLGETLGRLACSAIADSVTGTGPTFATLPLKPAGEHP
ncbi:MAG: hypothetical protein CMK32_14745 [Porticoccaceae bacterium]|nr:hypothetical protein [Porticoccaceae bacterium]